MKYLILIFCLFLFACEASHKNIGGHIYFVAKPIGPSLNVYSIDQKKQPKKYTNSELWRDSQFDVGPDGSVYFSSNRRMPGEAKHPLARQKFNVFKSAGDEAQVVRMTPGERVKLLPRVSKSGLWLAYRAIDRASKMEYLTLLNLQNNEEKILSSAKNISTFAWKKHCECLSYAVFDGEKSELRMFEVKGQTDTLLYSQPIESTQVVDMQWSYQDNYLAMVLNRLKVNYDLKLVVLEPAKPANLRQVSKDGQVVQEFFNWSPVKDQLLFTALVDFKFYFDDKTRRKVYEGEMRVFSTNAAGDEVTQVTFGEGLQNRPVFSPEGTHFAYINLQDFGRDRAALMVRPVKQGKAKSDEVWYDGVAVTSRLQWR